jgi:hypothetical protein
MAEICRTCGTDGTSTPCDGAVIKVYDISVRQEFEVIPNIYPSSDGTTYYYEFSYTSSEGTYDFVVYSTDAGVNWSFIRKDTQVKASVANVPAGSSCPPATGWTSTGLSKMFITGIENRLIPTNSLDPLGACYPSISVPSTANRLDYTEVLANFKTCFNTKVTTYYNKIIGGVPCDNMELVKMQLILNLLDKKDCDSNALECLYNRTSAPGIQFQELGTIPYLTTVFATPYDFSKVETTGDFRKYKGYNLKVTRGTGQEITHKIIDVDYVAGSNISIFTIYPAGEAPAYSALPVVFVEPTYTATTYLETFLNFANKYCADCIVTPSSVAVTGSGTKGKAPTTANLDPTADYLTKEGSLTTDNLIYLESEFPINLI